MDAIFSGKSVSQLTLQTWHRKELRHISLAYLLTATLNLVIYINFIFTITDSLTNLRSRA